MINIRKSEERGKANFGWLDANYSFSFSNYYDPDHTGFRDLLVLNQDTIEAGGGFNSHPHKDMEIITYIIDGEIEHIDSVGNKGIITKGEIQRMSAGSGIVHSEKNPSQENKTNLLQIWIKTKEAGVRPSYENKVFPLESGVKLLVSPNGEADSAEINQDFFLYGIRLEKEKPEIVHIQKGRHAWIQLIKGKLSVNGALLSEGDGAAISDIEELLLESSTDTELLLMNLK